MATPARWLGALALGFAALPAHAQSTPTYLVEQRAEVHGARMFASTATDPLRRRTLLFGGYTNGGIKNDTLEWDGIGWTRRFPSLLPSPRYSAGMAFESKRNRILLFGGIEEHRVGSGFSLADNLTWEWSGGDWRVLSTPNAPVARGTPAMAADPRSGDIYLFGGTLETELLDDFWRFDGQGWSPIPKAGAWPSGRAAATLGYDPVSQRMILFGGVDTFGINVSGNPRVGAPLVDTWSWDGQSWTALATSSQPEPRKPVTSTGETLPLMGRSILVTDEARGVLVLVQEAIEGMQIWRWDPRVPSWTQESSPIPDRTPNVRFFSSAFWDTARGELHLLGGLSTTIPSGSTPASLIADPSVLANIVDGTMANDEWGWNGSSWHGWQPPGQPGARAASAIAFHEELGVGVLFGGRYGSDTVLSDNFLWDGGRWYEGVHVDGSSDVRPSARSGHAMVYDAERSTPSGRGAIVLFGGTNASGAPLGDTWIWRDGWSTRYREHPGRAQRARARQDPRRRHPLRRCARERHRRTDVLPTLRQHQLAEPEPGTL